MSERPAKPTKHVSLAIYDDNCTWRVQARCNPAIEAESLICFDPTADTFALLHVVSELFKATETGAAAARKQASVSGPFI
jgi:hypothetical protein